MPGSVRSEYWGPETRPRVIRVTSMPKDVPSQISEDDREAAVPRLQDAFAEGHISHGEIDDHLQVVLTAKTHGDQVPVIASLPDTDTGRTLTLVGKARAVGFAGAAPGGYPESSRSTPSTARSTLICPVQSSRTRLSTLSCSSASAGQRSQCHATPSSTWTTCVRSGNNRSTRSRKIRRRAHRRLR
jgi:hypothetical protein